MLETVDLTKRMPQREYRIRLRPLQSYLHRLQRAYWEHGVSAIIVFEGWDAAGKGSSIRKLTERLEPRGFEIHRVRQPRSYEREMPWLWRYWRLVPAYGSLAIFDRSWYGRVLVQRVEGTDGSPDRTLIFRDINTFERALADDRYEVIKFFMHIDEPEQRRRLEELSADEHTRWQVDPEDWEHLARYDEFLDATEEALERTETEWAPWTIVAATDRFWTRIKVLETVRDRLEAGLEARSLPVPEDEWAEEGAVVPGADELDSDGGA